jgi:hypothetical protein
MVIGAARAPGGTPPFAPLVDSRCHTFLPVLA